MLKDEIMSQLDRFASYLAEVEGKPLLLLTHTSVTFVSLRLCFLKCRKSRRSR